MRPNIPREESWNRDLDAMRDTHISNDGAWSCDSECRLHRLVRPDAFKCSVDTYSVCQRKYRLACLFPTLGKDIRRTECSRKLLTSRVSAQGNDSLCPETFCRNDCTQTDRSISDDGNGIPLLHLCTDGGVVPCAHDIGEREQRGECFV